MLFVKYSFPLKEVIQYLSVLWQVYKPEHYKFVSANEEFDQQISNVTNFSVQIELHFNRVGFKTVVSVQPHIDCFLNSVDLTFSMEIAKWRPNADINSEV